MSIPVKIYWSEVGNTSKGTFGGYEIITVCGQKWELRRCDGQLLMRVKDWKDEATARAEARAALLAHLKSLVAVLEAIDP